MYKVALIVMMMAIWITSQLIQIEQQLAMKTVYWAKQAVNRSAHAAAQQLDLHSLSEGEFRIDEQIAKRVASIYLQQNLYLDENNLPLSASFLRHPVKLLVFDIINSEQSFPYHYVNTAYQYEVWLERPAVIMIVHVSYPKRFEAVASIDWILKGTAQLAYIHH